MVIELLYDFGSPTSYLAYTQLPAIAARTGARLELTPVLLGGIFKATGNASPASVPAKGKWMMGDMAMWARHYGVVFNRNPHFPINTLTLMRGAWWARSIGRLDAYSDAVFDAMWGAHPQNLGDEVLLTALLQRCGFDVEAFRAGVASEPVKDALKQATERAVARGVFGCPTMFVGDRMFFGQDRLAFVEAAVRDAARAA